MSELNSVEASYDTLIDREHVCPIFVSIKQVTKLIAVGQTTVWKLIALKELETARVRGRTLVTMRSITAFTERSIAKDRD